MRHVIIYTLFLLFSFQLFSQHEAEYYIPLENGMVQCTLCPRYCIIPPGGRGFCTVRVNRRGKLYTLVYSHPCAVHVDPIEKKPFFHVLPGTKAFSIATAGCNLRCLFCQNWYIAQRPPERVKSYNLSPEVIVRKAKEMGCKSIAYTYTEPVVFFEYMKDCCKLAKNYGIKNVVHTAGYINPEPLRELCRYVDAVNVDLKGFRQEFYDKLCWGGRLEDVLRTLKILKEEGVWIEVTNLIIPTYNDNPNDIRRMCEWIKNNLGEDVPLHFSRFFPMYKLVKLSPTPVSTLERAYKIAKEVGLKYVYLGNVPGSPYENTYCPKCGKVLIKRVGYVVLENNIKDGRCPYCGEKIPGVWK
ncbi:AmmeMemoRadiSam system radical SAM enzyme [Candidatus Calescamantes bacterium]|nr:AmmeMemoRadiSam system radical SAM enzyme [Candidatus Calescamantes bacterium]